MRIFIAGPYGDQNPKEVIAENVRKADEAARELVSMGLTPYCPHTMSWGWEDDERLDPREYYRMDKDWMSVCHALLFLAPSPGANRERQMAYELGLRVFNSIEEIKEYLQRVSMGVWIEF